MAGAIMVSASTGVMNSLLGKLTTLMGQEYAKITGVRKQVGFLKDELSSMNALLEKLADVDELDPQGKEWTNQVREMSYDIEDFIDDFMHHQADASANVGFLGKAVERLKALKMRRGFADPIRDLKDRVKEVSERRMRYKLDDCISTCSHVDIDPRMPALYEEVANIVGMDSAKGKLIMKLIEEDGESMQQLKVISIFGFGGLGKTTLAKVLYDEIKAQFDCEAFVSVSQKPDIAKLLQSTLGRITRKELEEACEMQDLINKIREEQKEACEVQDLINKIREYIKDKRYLFVIDDLWDTAAWNTLKCAFPDNHRGSRIITTTRIESVAKACCSYNNEWVYKMEPLSDHYSGILFFNRVFGSEKDCPQQFKEVSDEILKKCGGVPLAIISLASLLASQPNRSIDLWNDVRNYISNSCLRSHPSIESMMRVLSLSYNHLPRHLKTCLLYMGIYPEDYEISKDDLVRQWVDHGFVSETQERDAEKVATSYFNELINRSMIKPVYYDFLQSVERCQVHDMVLDLIRLESVEENFFTVTDDPEGIPTELQFNVRRLCLHLFDTKQDTAALPSMNLSQLRLLVVFGGSSRMFPLVELKFLRVLMVKVRGSENNSSVDLTAVCKMFQLRYLSWEASPAVVVKLPPRIRGLKQLHTLIIRARVDCLPSDIIYLRRLVRLKVRYGTGYLPDKIGSMKSLRTLGLPFDFAGSSLDSINGLGELTNLGYLHLSRCCSNKRFIPKQEYMDALQSSLGKLANHNLRRLLLPCSGNCSSNEGSSLLTFPSCPLVELYGDSWLFPSVPKWIGELYNLKHLVLLVEKLGKDDVGILAGLPSLRGLALYISGSSAERIIICGSTAFPVLDIFIFRSRVQCLAFSSGAMPKLQMLRLFFYAHGAEQRGAMYAGIDNLLSLKMLYARIARGDVEESDGRAAEAALRDVASLHPGHPTIDITWRSGGIPFGHQVTYHLEVYHLNEGEGGR